MTRSGPNGPPTTENQNSLQPGTMTAHQQQQGGTGSFHEAPGNQSDKPHGHASQDKQKFSAKRTESNAHSQPNPEQKQQFSADNLGLSGTAHGNSPDGSQKQDSNDDMNANPEVPSEGIIDKVTGDKETAGQDNKRSTEGSDVEMQGAGTESNVGAGSNGDPSGNKQGQSHSNQGGRGLGGGGRGHQGRGGRGQGHNPAGAGNPGAPTPGGMPGPFPGQVPYIGSKTMLPVGVRVEKLSATKDAGWHPKDLQYLMDRISSVDPKATIYNSRHEHSSARSVLKFATDAAFNYQNYFNIVTMNWGKPQEDKAKTLFSFYISSTVITPSLKELRDNAPIKKFLEVSKCQLNTHHLKESMSHIVAYFLGKDVQHTY